MRKECGDFAHAEGSIGIFITLLLHLIRDVIAMNRVLLSIVFATTLVSRTAADTGSYSIVRERGIKKGNGELLISATVKKRDSADAVHAVYIISTGDRVSEQLQLSKENSKKKHGVVDCVLVDDRGLGKQVTPDGLVDKIITHTREEEGFTVVLFYENNHWWCHDSNVSSEEAQEFGRKAQEAFRLYQRLLGVAEQRKNVPPYEQPKYLPEFTY